ncbi:hypothetical protein [Anaeromassilibacillus sp. SJQ-5]
MADTHQIRCPQCATLYDEGEARCPHCGLPAEPAARQRHIEQLLEHTAAGPAAGAPIRTDPASAAFAPPEPAIAVAERPSRPPAAYVASPIPAVQAAFGEPLPPPAGSAVPGSGWACVPLGHPVASAKEPSPVGPFLKKHRFKLLAAAVAVAAVVVLTLVIGAVRSTTASFRSSPERLVAGLQKALDDKDVRLFAELALPAGVEYNASDYSRLTASDLPNLQLELVEVFSGRKDTYALAIVRYTERESLSPGDGQMEVLMLRKTDGKWYNSNTTNAFLRGLLGTVDYSYQYDPDSYDDPYAVPD